MDDLEIVRSDGRFEMIHDGRRIGMLEFIDRGDALEFYRIRLSQPYAGRGLADRLTDAALHDLRTHGERLVPRSAYVRGYILAHPQWQDLLTGDARASLGL